jgi:NADH:ubiquinone oxidoreductase subunit 6 (subunit J)
LKIFRTDSYYRYILLAISVICVFAAALSFYSKAKPLELLLLVFAGAVAVLITVYIWSVKVRAENGFIHKKNLFGSRTVEISSVEEITLITLMGRYVFTLITANSFLMLSSMLENFQGLKDILKNSVTEKVFEGVSNISDEHLTRKKKVMKLMLAALLILCAVVFIYQLKEVTYAKNL